MAGAVRPAFQNKPGPYTTGLLSKLVSAKMPAGFGLSRMKGQAAAGQRMVLLSGCSITNNLSWYVVPEGLTGQFSEFLCHTTRQECVCKMCRW